MVKKSAFHKEGKEQAKACRHRKTLNYQYKFLCVYQLTEAGMKAQFTYVQY